jgi:uncharacterized protein YoxC
MIIEISVAVIALAFVALVVYLILLLNGLRGTLKQVDKTIIEVRMQLDEMGNQAKKAIEHTNQVSFDLKRKMEALNSLFNTVSNLGDILEHKTFALKKEALSSSHKERSGVDSLEAEQEAHAYDEIHVSDILELAGIGARLWHKIRHKYLPVAKNKE